MGLTLLARAHELLVDRELLDAFARCFAGREDVTLAVWAPDSAPGVLESALVPLLREAGLSADGGPAVLGLPIPATAQNVDELVEAADCLLSRRLPHDALSLLARFGADSLEELLSPSQRGGSAPRPDESAWEPPLDLLLAQLDEPLRAQRTDPVRGFVGDLTPGRETLYLFFSGLDDAPLPLQYNWSEIAETLGAPFLCVRDHAQCWYHRGVAQLGSGIGDTAASLRALVDAAGAERLVCVGNSAGGYAALLFGALLGADDVRVLAPQTFLSAALRDELDERRWQRQVDRLHARVGNEGAVDLAPFLRDSLKHAVVAYATDSREDVLHVQRLAACTNVELRAYREGGHDLVGLLYDRGDLSDLLVAAR